MSAHLLIQADSRRIPLADGSVHCVVTSPPYWGLRSYGHWYMQRLFGDISHFRPPRRSRFDRWLLRLFWRAAERGGIFSPDGHAWIGALGLEPTPDMFVQHMVAVFREVRRVLRDDGTLWLNLGDSYAATTRGSGGKERSGLRRDGRDEESRLRSARLSIEHQELKDRTAFEIPAGLKPKDLIGIPWRVALALQQDGWWLRSEIIWAKPNPMPESVTDRPTKAHEQLFLLAKSERYFYDAEAVREAQSPGAIERFGNGGAPRKVGRKQAEIPGDSTHLAHGSYRTPNGILDSGRNLRTVWTIPTEAYPGAHFATFPRRLVEPCIKAGTSQRGVCPECGAPWERVVERAQRQGDYPAYGDDYRIGAGVGNGSSGRKVNPAGGSTMARFLSSTLGWRPTCPHDHDPIPATILDPFCGSGTSLVVANALGRRAIGLDLSREYLGLAQRRVTRPHARPPRPGRSERYPLFDGAIA